MTPRAPRIAAYGFFGMGNLGNEGSLAALLAYLDKAHPGAELHCFATGPDAVTQEHGIPATQLMSYRADPRRQGSLVKVQKAMSRLWDVPRTFMMMRDVDVVVVPGTGVLETRLMSTPWGLPFWLFLATASCRLLGRKVALVSVGAEYAEHPVTRRLFRWTVRLSHYCSYRDEESRDAVRSMGVQRQTGEVFPDLAFSLRTPAAGPARPGHVVIGVMAYDGDPADPRRRSDLRRVYVADMVELITRLVDAGRTVTLVVGDVHDHTVAAEIAGLVRTRRPGLTAGAVAHSRADSMDAVMKEMAEAEVVVASRFHNVICALMLEKPTISLGYAEKNRHLLAGFGLAEFDHPIDSFDVDRVVGQIATVRDRHSSVEPLMKDTLQRFEDELAEQYRRLSADVIARYRRRPG